MKPESLIQLIGSGNTTTVDEEWMRMLEAPDLPLARMVGYRDVLAELCRMGKASQAEELAWAAVEAISMLHTPLDAITVAAPFLLAVRESEDLRAQVVELYRLAYAGCDGLESLLAESGLGGSRPARRALRTLDVCLTLNEGDYLAARDEDAAARVDKTDRGTWRFTITTADGEETLGAVHLADRYQPASPTEFLVMRQFLPDQLAKRLWNDIGAVVTDICRRNGDGIDSDRLEQMLVPGLLSEANWKRWWTKARAVVKRSSHLRIEGRSPYRLTYVDRPLSLEDELAAELERPHDPLGQLEVVEKCLRDCIARNEEPSEDALRRWHDHFARRAEQLTTEGSAGAGLWWMAARRVAELGGFEAGSDGAVDLLRTADDLGTIFAQIEDEALLELACACLVSARPDDWQNHLMALLPTLPSAVCDRAARRLVSAGLSAADFEPVVHRIVGSPGAHFGALLWLWDGPSNAKHIPVPAPVTLLSRILRGLDECRRSDSMCRDDVRKMGARVRQILSARKYQRFDQCLQGIEPGMAQALHTQVRQLDLLGVSVHENLLARLRAKFPPEEAASETPPWLREDVLYVTEAGLAKKRKDVDHHVNVKMRENAKAIGRAAEHGDLSENSEYKFALEERDLLRARLAQMNDELALAHIFRPADVPTDEVGIGTTVILKRVTDGERYDMSILGAWEADASKRWFNYKTPLARKVLGKCVGDTVEFDHTGASGTYEIIALENVLATDE